MLITLEDFIATAKPCDGGAMLLALKLGRFEATAEEIWEFENRHKYWIRQYLGVRGFSEQRYYDTTHEGAGNTSTSFITGSSLCLYRFEENISATGAGRTRSAWTKKLKWRRDYKLTSGAGIGANTWFSTSGSGYGLSYEHND